MTRTLAPVPAKRTAVKARIAIMGITGSGKTRAALMLASTLGKRTLLIQTEPNGDNFQRGKFPEYEIQPFTPPFDCLDLVDYIQQAVGKYDTVIVDAWSDFWIGEGGMWDRKIKTDFATNPQTGKKLNPNKFANFTVVNEQAHPMMRALRDVDINVILTMQARLKYVQSGDTIRPKGLGPQMRQECLQLPQVIIELGIDEDNPQNRYTAKVWKDRIDYLATAPQIQTFNPALCKSIIDHLGSEAGSDMANRNLSDVALIVIPRKVEAKNNGWLRLICDNEIVAMKANAEDVSTGLPLLLTLYEGKGQTQEGGKSYAQFIAQKWAPVQSEEAGE